MTQDGKASMVTFTHNNSADVGWVRVTELDRLGLGQRAKTVGACADYRYDHKSGKVVR